MNVFFLTHWYPEPDSPIQGIFVREHAQAISQLHKVHIVYVKGLQPEKSSSIQVNLRKDGEITIYTISYPRARIPKMAWLQRIIGVFNVFKELASSKERPDIIHANVYNTADLAAMLGKRHNVPAVLTEHASSYPRQLFGKAQAFKVRTFVNQLQLIMPVSQDLGYHMRRFGIHGPFRSISNTVDVNLFHPGLSKLSESDGINRILVVARLDKVKGIDQLLQSLSIIKRDGRQFQLLIAGDGPERNELESLACRLNISAETHFLGYKNRQEVAELMRCADFFALTSRWDNQPVVLLEAMASGLPVIASNVGGIPEILPESCGRLIESDNLRSLQEQLVHMLDNSKDYSSQAIVEYAQANFSYTAIGEAFSQAYTQVIENYQR